VFSGRSKGRRNGGEPFTYIHEGTTVHGDLEAAGRVRIHGTVLGNVIVAGVLEVAAEGTIRGERVEADQVRILGAVEAMVSAAGKVEIWRGGQLTGDVRAASLDIEEGASFTGRSEMRPPGTPPALPDGRRNEQAAPAGKAAVGGASARAADQGDTASEAAGATALEQQA
jgi:cytoskeletal protein CcmA (bactofilin family)